MKVKKFKIFVLVLVLTYFIPSLSFSQVDTAWIRKYNGPGNGSDRAYALSVDNKGNVYVTGGSDNDYTTIKYNAQGDTVWVRKYDGPGNGIDIAYAIALDNDGNVYVTGYSYGSGTSYDYATIKYDSLGQELWVRRYNGSGNGIDIAYAITVDNNGNVYVTGRSYGGNTGDDYATIKYDANGNEIWVKRYNWSGNSEDCAYGIALDNNNNIYVTGVCATGSVNNCVTIKYDTNGNQIWVRTNEGGANTMVIDNLNNLYVAGRTRGAGGSQDYLLIKYDANGNVIWSKTYNGPANGMDIANAVSVDNNGNVYVTGYSYGSGTGNDYATIKYNRNGDTIWIRRYNGVGNGDDNARAIAVDNDGYVYVTGYSRGFGNYDFVTVMYDTNGNMIWEHRYNGSGNGDDDAYGIKVDNYGRIYVTGYSYGSGTSYDYTTIKYIKLIDVGACEIVSPSGIHPRDTSYKPVIGKVKTYCSYPTTFWTFFKIYKEDSLIYIDSVRKTLIPPAESIINFDSFPWAKDTGEYRAVLKTALIGDINPANDSISEFFTIVSFPSGMKEELIIKIEEKEVKGRKNLYNIIGKLVKEKKLKKGIYFQRTEEGIEKILILK